MATLASLSTLKSESGRGTGAVGHLLSVSPFLRYMEQVSGWQEDSTKFSYETTEGASDAPARALNGDYTANNRERADPLAGALRFHGDSFATDVSLLADAERGLRNYDKWLEQTSTKQVRAFGKKFEQLVFQSDGTGNSIKGLNAIFNGTDDIPGFTGYKGVVSAADSVGGGAVSMDLSVTANKKKLIQLLKRELALMENPTGIIMHPDLWTEIEDIAVELKYVTMGSPDTFGDAFPKFRNVPVIGVLPTTISLEEPDDTPTTPLENTTSIWIMGPGEEIFSLRSNSGFYYIDWNHPANKMQGVEKFEIRSAWSVVEKDSVRRIRNIKKS